MFEEAVRQPVKEAVLDSLVKDAARVSLIKEAVLDSLVKEAAKQPPNSKKLSKSS